MRLPSVRTTPARRHTIKPRPSLAWNGRVTHAKPPCKWPRRSAPAWCSTPTNATKPPRPSVARLPRWSPSRRSGARIQHMADRWGITIDSASGMLHPPHSTDPDEQAEIEHHMSIVHDAIVDLLRKADSTDQNLATAVNGAISDMADALGTDSITSPEDARKTVEEGFRHRRCRRHSWNRPSLKDIRGNSPRRPA